MVCLWLDGGAKNSWCLFLFWHPTKPGGRSILFQSHSKFTKAVCFSSKKSQSMLLNVIPTQRFRVFCQPCKINISLSYTPFFQALSSVPLCLPLSPFLCLSQLLICRLMGGASEGMSGRSVWGTKRILLGERDVSLSLRACLWSYPQLGDNRWCRRKENPGNHPGAGWQRGEVSVEKEKTESGRVARATPSRLSCSRPVI